MDDTTGSWPSLAALVARVLPSLSAAYVRCLRLGSNSVIASRAAEGRGSEAAGAATATRASGDAAPPPPLVLATICTFAPLHPPAAKCQPSGKAGAAGSHGAVFTSAAVTCTTRAPFLKRVAPMR